MGVELRPSQRTIAQQPCEPRDAACLLVLDRNSARRTEGVIGVSYRRRIFRDLPEFLKAGDCLALNDTKALPARIYGRKAVTGGKVELLLLSEGQPEGAESMGNPSDQQ